MDSDFYGIDTDTSSESSFRTAVKLIESDDKSVTIGYKCILFASVITSRARDASPSKILEDKVLKASRRNTATLTEALLEAWNVSAEQAARTFEIYEILLNHVTPHYMRPKNRDVLLEHANNVADSLLDYWTSVADLYLGVKTIASRVLDGSTINVSDHLKAGIKRSRLRRAWNEGTEE